MNRFILALIAGAGFLGGCANNGIGGPGGYETGGASITPLDFPTIQQQDQRAQATRQPLEKATAQGAPAGAQTGRERQPPTQPLHQTQQRWQGLQRATGEVANIDPQTRTITLTLQDTRTFTMSEELAQKLKNESKPLSAYKPGDRVVVGYEGDTLELLLPEYDPAAQQVAE